MKTSSTPAGASAAPALHSESRRSHVSWGAIVAGVVIAIVVQMVLSLLGAGIGLSTMDPMRYSSPDASSFGIGAGAWWAVSSMISLFAGGAVAAHLAGSPEKTDAMLHGLLTWGLATIVTAYLLASAVGAVVRGGASMVGTAATVTASGAAAVAGPAAEMAKKQLDASGISWDSIKGQAQQLLAQTGKPALKPGAIEGKADASIEGAKSAAMSAGSNGGASGSADLQAAIEKIINSGKDTVDQVDRDAVVNVVMTRSSVTKPEAEARVDGWIKTYQDARVKFEQQKVAAEAKARQVADATAKASSQAALAAVVALVLGALAAAFGGIFAGRRYFMVTSTTTNVRNHN
jgi:hypothetical protein